MTNISSSSASAASLHPRFQWNTLFRGDPQRSNFNACVGNNGAPGIYEYADGFAESVVLLIEGLTQHKGSLDTLIYPICFNLRHSVELTIKALIGDLTQLAKVSNRPLTADVNSVIGQHDIKNLWDYFVQKSAVVDRRFSQETAPLDAHIKCIAETDPTGQTFRYSYDTLSVKHLTDVSLINVLVLQEQFKDIKEHFEKIRHLMGYLRLEYRTGTFTRNLSRADIVSIAELLPARKQWGAANFTAAKTLISTTYGLSGKELSLAFAKIQKTRDTARMIGLSVTVPGLSEADFIELNDIWKTAWDCSVLAKKLREYIYGREIASTFSGPVPMSEELNFLDSAQKDLGQAGQLFKQWATPEKLAGITALQHSGGDLFCEEHDHRFAYYLEEMNAMANKGSEIWQAEIDGIWTSSVSRPYYPAQTVEKLKRAGFTHEAATVADHLFA
ncbi:MULTISPECIES: hypothetical protein [Yersinia]|uniref:Uncharacterized protein n=1 Tax=Yersinia massiliensis TaxID=419257 RepID=A0ABM6V0S2_9GAMM|nr:MULTISPECIES: hypothetical protein [Yersinia]AVX40608.1 hypothetical protein DA391_23285 [Yersinia massiliensis]OWF70771.1 hypothetical protein B4902_21685 [Yersinia frederiksenii]